MFPQNLRGQQPIDRAQRFGTLLQPQPDATGALRNAAEQRRVARLSRVARRLDRPTAAGDALGAKPGWRAGNRWRVRCRTSWKQSTINC